MRLNFNLLGIAALVLGVATGCSDSAKDDMSQAGSNVTQAADNVGNAVKSTADTASDVAGNIQVTSRVKTALGTTEGVDAAKIDVDTTGTTVTLKGVVDNAAAKQKAIDAAKLAAGDGFTIVDKLAVTPD